MRAFQECGLLPRRDGAIEYDDEHDREQRDAERAERGACDSIGNADIGTDHFVEGQRSNALSTAPAATKIATITIQVCGVGIFR